MVTFYQRTRSIADFFIPGIFAQQIVNLIFAIYRFSEYGFFEALGRTTFAVILGLVFTLAAIVLAAAISYLIDIIKVFKADNRA
jgi:hypothetical protein